jgi:hypothetical protein
VGAPFGSSRFSATRGLLLGPTVGVAMRWNATIATVDNRSSAVLDEVGAGTVGRGETKEVGARTEGVGAGTEGVGAGTEGVGAGAEGAGISAGVGRMGGASLSLTRLGGGSLGASGVAASAVGISATEGSGATVRARTGAEMRTGTGMAAVGMGALRATSGLEWYPNQNTVACAGGAGGRLGG